MKPSPYKRWWGQPLWDRWRALLWRHQLLASFCYVLLVSALPAFLWLYPRTMSPGMDLGLTVAVRHWFHSRSFLPLEKARREIERGDLDQAESRLVAFLGDHGDCQKGQLYTQAVSDAHELLSELYLQQGRLGRSERTLEEALERTPLHWRLWARLGDCRRERGDLSGAAEAYREAFKLTLDLPDLTESYLEVLGEIGEHEAVLWVHDHFQRSRERVAPLVEVKAGPARSDWHHRGLDLVGIEVEHGDYTRSLRRHGLDRGEDCRLALPGRLFTGFEQLERTYLQIRFHNVYGDLSITELEWFGEDGRVQSIALGEDQIARQHREGSGGDYHIEMNFRLPETATRQLVVVYSCPEHELSGSARDIVANARRNLDVRER